MNAVSVSQQVGIVAYGWPAWHEVAAIWSGLVERIPGCSAFLTASWIGVWLEVYGPKVNPTVLLFSANGETIGAVLLANNKRRVAMVPVRRVSLNASGEAGSDTTYCEFNNLLCVPGWERQLAQSLQQYILSMLIFLLVDFSSSPHKHPTK